MRPSSLRGVEFVQVARRHDGDMTVRRISGPQLALPYGPGRALQAESDDLEVVDLALLYPGP